MAEPTPTIKSTPKVRYMELFTSFLKIGLFTIGGGYAMVPLIQREVVNHRGWVEDRDFLDLLTLAQSIPGPIALNSSAFVGYKTRGYTGALASLLGIVVPSFVIILMVALFFNSIRDNEIVEAAFKAMRPVVIALILSPMLSFLKGMNMVSILIVILSMVLIAYFEISPAIMIFGSAFCAVIWTYYIGLRSKRGSNNNNNREEGKQ